MPSLPKPVHEFLESEFKFAAAKVAEATNIAEKVYYFSVFYGQAGRQLNLHWDADLALLWSVGQSACTAINLRLTQSTGSFPVGGLPDGFMEALDEVSLEFAGAFEGGQVDVPRLYAALARTAELTYITTGNGAYLNEKGMIRL